MILGWVELIILNNLLNISWKCHSSQNTHQAKYTILTLKEDFDIRLDVVTCQHWHSNAEISYEAWN